MQQRDWQDDEEDWSEAGGEYDDGDLDGADDSDTIPCPECGTEIYADLDHCPQCGHWLIDADHADRGSGLFASHRVRVMAAILLAIFVLGLLAGIMAI